MQNIGIMNTASPVANIAGMAKVPAGSGTSSFDAVLISSIENLVAAAEKGSDGQATMEIMKATPSDGKNPSAFFLELLNSSQKEWSQFRQAPNPDILDGIVDVVSKENDVSNLKEPFPKTSPDGNDKEKNGEPPIISKGYLKDAISNGKAPSLLQKTIESENKETPHLLKHDAKFESDTNFQRAPSGLETQNQPGRIAESSTTIQNVAPKIERFYSEGYGDRSISLSFIGNKEASIKLQGHGEIFVSMGEKNEISVVISADVGSDLSGRREELFKYLAAAGIRCSVSEEGAGETRMRRRRASADKEEPFRGVSSLLFKA